MHSAVNPLEALLPHPVRGDTDVPRQQICSMTQLKAEDTYQQTFIKCPERCVLRSYAKLLHAALLEADPSVISFIPQPYTLKLQGRDYQPAVYVLRSDGRRQVIDLRDGGEFDEGQKTILTAFFEKLGLEFTVLSNESVLKRQQEARNWLCIIRVMALANRYAIDTSLAEHALWQHGLSIEGATVADFYNVGDQSPEEYEQNVAFFRLLHQHYLACDLTKEDLHPDLKVTLCT